MLLKFNEELSNNCKKSNSQKIRVLSESWFEEYGYCVKCGSKLEKFKNNKPVNDFYCPICKEEYELKSRKGKSNIIVGGAYNKMLEKLESNSLPNLICLTYKEGYEITDITVIPRFYFSKSTILPRKPLSLTARRAGWQGCTINIKNIHETGKLHLVKNSQVLQKEDIVNQYNKMLFLNIEDYNLRGWTLDILICIEFLNIKIFTLSDIYSFIDILKLKHPNNNNIKAKIRQQLQFLRNYEYLDFLGKGKYMVR